MQMTKPSVYEFNDYKAFVRAWIDARPHQGRGEYRKIAGSLGLSTTLVSQIFNGERQLGLEHAMNLASFMGLRGAQVRFFLLLVSKARAASVVLREEFEQQISEAREARSAVGRRITNEKTLSPEVAARFYSSWIPAAIRNLAATGLYGDFDSLAERLRIETATVADTVEFLLSAGMLKKKSGKLVEGVSFSHVSNTSPFSEHHHRNWRIRSAEYLRTRAKGDLVYTAPMSLSVELAKQIRNQLLAIIEEVSDRVPKSKSETARCLLIDWTEL